MKDISLGVLGVDELPKGKDDRAWVWDVVLRLFEGSVGVGVW